MKNWIKENKDIIYRIWEYRLPGAYTPYEQEQCFSDESLLEEITCKFCRFTNVIELGSGDWLLECQMLDGEYGEVCESDIERYEYHKLSRLIIQRYPNDTKSLEESEDSDNE